MDLNRRAFKSGTIYALASLLNAFFVFVTTPYFTRTMEPIAYGEYNNFLSWYNIFSVITLNLSSTFISARKDHESDYESYILSMVALNLSISVFFMIVILVFANQISSLTSLSIGYLLVLLIYASFNQIFLMYQVNERFNFRYKMSTVLIVLCNISSTVLSMLLVIVLENQLLARICGLTIPTIFTGFVCLIIFIKHKGRIRFSYWMYALPICIPYIPHLLSLNILNSSDKTMITNMIGSEETAIYSVAYTCGSVVSLIIGIMNNAFAPWLIEQLSQKCEKEIFGFSRYYVWIFQILVICILFFAPEIIMILGGRQYYDAVDILPAIIIGCSLQLIYTMCVNVEQFLKKTKGMALVSVLAAITNVLLNYIFLPLYGYKVAAITTLVSYVVLVGGHTYIIKQLGYKNIFDFISIYCILAIDFVLVFVFGLIYESLYVRLVLLGLFMIFGLFILVKNREDIKRIFTYFLNGK